MNSRNGALAWALATLCIGVALAYLFQRKVPDSAPQDLSDASVGSPMESVADILGQNLELQPHDVLPASTSATASADQVPQLQLASQRLSPPLPEWVHPRTQLDDLVTSGAASRAGEHQVRELDVLPTWISQPGMHSKRAANNVADQDFAPSTDPRNTEGGDTPDGWTNSLRGSPFNSQSAKIVKSLAGSRASQEWPDKNVALAARLQQQSKKLERKQDHYGASLVGTKLGEANGNRSSVQLWKSETPVADRSRQFVFQPGFDSEGSSN